MHQQGIIDLILPIQQQEFQIPITIADQPDLNDIPNIYQTGRGNFWVATIDGTIVGSIALIDIGDNRAALRKMFVATDYRGKPWSTGRLLLDELLKWAAEKGITEILLGTATKLIGAQRFYEKNGFEEIEKSALPASFPIMAVDGKFYKYTLQ